MKEYDKAYVDFEKVLKYNRGFSADAKYYKAIIYKATHDIENAKLEINKAIEDFENGYFNQRPYVETMRQIYREDLERLKIALGSGS